MRWYADDSDMRTIKDLRVPNMILFGGIVVSQENEKKLRAAVESAKENFGHKRLPVKWNFKDLKTKYEEQGHSAQYQTALEKMHELRKAIFENISTVDFSIIVSAVLGYSTDKKVLVDLKHDLSRHVFSNGLMRYAQHVKETSPSRAEVILDWPDGGNSKPFDTEYASAYNTGKSKDGVPYMSGALEDLGFNDSANYTRMPHSTLMQLSDLVVGCTREFMQHALNEEQCGHGVKLLGSIANKFRGYPSNVIGRGISINTRATSTREKIKGKFKILYLERS